LIWLVDHDSNDVIWRAGIGRGTGDIDLHRVSSAAAATSAVAIAICAAVERSTVAVSVPTVVFRTTDLVGGFVVPVVVESD
jgi:hypothetical protein